MTNSARRRRSRSGPPSQWMGFATTAAFRRARLSANHPIGRQSRPYTEAIESRVLLSAYALNPIGYFGGNATGANPQSTLVADAGGNLYGTASKGGAYGDGTVFEIAIGSNTITTLASFNGTNGANPYAGVTLDASGNIYGTAEYGGVNNSGTLFEIPRGSNAITTLAVFDGTTNGAYPVGALTLDPSGNLYGTTSGYPGTGDTVFEIPKGSTTLTTLAGFTTGYAPYGPMTIDASGNLWGTTEKGGANQEGTVFKIAAGSHTITGIASFNGANGSNPMGALALDGAGNLYGTTQGASGTVFEIASGSAAITTLAEFNFTNGSSPMSGVTLDASGNLYGTTATGGYYNSGTAFEIAKGTNSVTTLATFLTNGNDRGPVGGLMLGCHGQPVRDVLRRRDQQHRPGLRDRQRVDRVHDGRNV